MIEFSTPVTEAQRAFLAGDKAVLSQTKGGRELWQNRVKKATEAYKEAKANYTDFDLDGMPVDEDRTTGLAPGFPDWPTYRDNFLLDWINNRTVVSEEEADAIFEREAAAALGEIEADGEDLDALPPVDEDEAPASIVEAEAEAEAEPVEADAEPEVEVEAEAESEPVHVERTAKKKPGRPPRKDSASAKARGIIERYRAREWSRKEILEKLQSQLGMGPAYAATLYQKFAK